MTLKLLIACVNFVTLMPDYQFLVVTTKGQISVPEVMIPHRKWRIITWKWLSAGETWKMG